MSGKVVGDDDKAQRVRARLVRLFRLSDSFVALTPNKRGVPPEFDIKFQTRKRSRFLGILVLVFVRRGIL